MFSPPGLKGSLLIVSVSRGHAGIADSVTAAVRGSKTGVFFQYIMVVEDDVEATELTEALHAAMAKTHPTRGVQIFGLSPGNPLIPFLDLHDKMHSRGSTITLDATTPIEEGRNAGDIRRMSFDSAYSDSVKKHVLENWETKYGLPAGRGRGLH